MAPIKRPAGAAGAASKRGKKDPVLAKCGVIEAALEQATFLPDAARTMLTAMVSSCLTTVKEERHPYQVTTVARLGGILAGIQEKIEKELAEATAKVGGIEAMKLEREAALVEAGAALTALQGATAGCKTALEEAEAAEAAAKASEKDVRKAQAEADAGLDEMAAQKGALEAAKGTELATLGAEDVPEKAKKAALKTLVKLGKAHSFDGSLLDALPTVLKKDGGGFAAVITKQLEEEFEKAIAGLAKSIEDGAPGKAERAAGAEAAKGASEAAAAKAQESAAALEAAKVAEKAGATALKAAKQSVASYLPDVKEVMDKYDDLKASLPAFIEGPLAAYGELKELMPPPPPPEEPVEPPAAAEEPAAAVAA